MAKRNSKTQPAASSATPAVSSNTLLPKGFDAELDALFSNSANAAEVKLAEAAAPFPTESRKRKAAVVEESEPGEVGYDHSDSTEDTQGTTHEEIAMSDIERELEEQGLAVGSSEGEFEEGDDEDLEDDETTSSSDDDEGSESSAGESSLPTHEALAGEARAARVRRKVAERDDEPKEVRDKRSIFIGNLSIECVQSKTLTKALRKHVISHSPYPSVTRIEALRYRSVAFSTPTADYAAQSGAEAAANEKRRARARSFKDAVAAAEAADGKGPATVYLNANQKRKVAYINHEINTKAKSVNAYLTFEKLTAADSAKLQELSEATSTSATTSSKDNADKVTTPILAALTAAQVDETLFEGRHLRADLAAPLDLNDLVTSGLDRLIANSDESAGTETLARILSAGGSGGSARREDQSKTLFVGNLSFEADEEDLRAMLEATLCEERGKPPVLETTISETLPSLPRFEKREEGSLDAFRQRSWVQSVRIIRDAATQMGKGFGYVRFLDEICVDELMAIWESDEAFLEAAKVGHSGADGKREDGSRKDFKRRLKLNKRPLRLARCKGTGSNGAAASKNKDAAGRKVASASSSPAAARTPQRVAPSQNDGTRRRRSMGAPTPGGSSPSGSRKAPRLHSGDGVGSPTSKTKAASSETGVKKSPALIVPNPSPAQPRSASDLARRELKRNDPERQAKRLAKKERKRSQLAMAGDASADRKQKVDLSKTMKKQQKKNSARPAAAGGKGKRAPGVVASGKPPAVKRRKT